MNSEEGSATKLKLFIIEDSELIVDLVKDQIDQLSAIELVGTSDRVEGSYVQISKTQPDLVILDMKLKEGIGLDILKEIRKNKLEMKVAVFTMYRALENKCKEAGCDFFLDKSSDFEELQNIIMYMAYRQIENDETKNY